MFCSSGLTTENHLSIWLCTCFMQDVHSTKNLQMNPGLKHAQTGLWSVYEDWLKVRFLGLSIDTYLESILIESLAVVICRGNANLRSYLIWDLPQHLLAHDAFASYSGFLHLYLVPLVNSDLLLIMALDKMVLTKSPHSSHSL